VRACVRASVWLLAGGTGRDGAGRGFGREAGGESESETDNKDGEKELTRVFIY
jgi:hypothetical protein